MRYAVRRRYARILLAQYLVVLAALTACVAAVYAPLEVRVRVEQLLLPYSVEAVYVYRAWLGAGHYTVCFEGVKDANLTLIWASSPSSRVNTSISVLSGSRCLMSNYTSSPIIIVIRVRIPPYTTHVGELIVSRVGW